MNRSLAAALLLFLAACTGSAGEGEILRVAFERRAFDIYAPGDIVLYGDGRLVRAARSATPADPLLPSLRVLRLSAEGVEFLTAAAEQAGLAGGDRTLDGPPSGVPGAQEFLTLTTLTFDDGTSHETRVEDIDRYFGGRQVDFGLRDSRLKVLELYERLQDPEASLPDGSIEERGSETPARLIVQISPAFSPAAQQVDWPLGDLAGAGVELERPDGSLLGPPALRCLVVEGEDLAQVYAAAGDARFGAGWTSQGRGYNLVTRPLLDGEPGCPE